MPTIAIIDDHELLLDGLREIFEKEEDLVVFTFRSANAFLADLKAHIFKPDLVITDIQMPDKSGIELIGNLSYTYRDIKIMVMSMLMGDDLIAALLDCGIDGYFVKGGSAKELVKAAKTILNGKKYFSELVSDSVEKYYNGESMQLLSSRELEISTYICKGLTTKEISEKLFISIHTVQTHRKNIFKKLDIHNASELFQTLIQKRLLVL